MTRESDNRRYADQARQCPLSRWHGDPARCRWCNRPAVAGHHWCGSPCEDEYRTNHWWDIARYAALARDGHRCVRCGMGPDTVSQAKRVLALVGGLGPVDAAHLWHTEAWRWVELDASVEVHHVKPRLGRGYGSGCHHHLDGLETLCHHHHVAVTEAARQVG